MEEVVETIVEEAIVIAETAADKIGIGEAAVYAILGYVVVFFGISLLMFVVMAMGKAFIAKDRKAAAAKAAAPTPAAAAPAEAPKPTAPGELKLHDVEPKIAAMLMAIVADKMGKPLNELRFISIKEVK